MSVRSLLVSAMAQDTELIQSGAGQLIELESIMKLPWEGLLQSAPLSIFLLGQLVVVSARRDFQLEMNVNRPYQRLRHSTFRPTVVQVVNEAWVAFNHAHTNMDQVRLHMLSIPRNVRVTLRIMNRDQQFAHFVKIPLKAIEQSADEAAQLSLDIYNKFYNIQLLLAEVAEALASTQGGTDEQLRQAQEDRKLAEMEKKLQDERQAKARGELNKISGELDAARSAYEEAIRSIPTGFKAFFMDLVRFVPNLIPKIGDGQTIPFETAAVDQQQELSVNDLSLIGMADNIERGVIRLIQTLNSGGNGAFDHLNTFKKGLSDLKRQAASKTDAKLFGPVNELVNTGFSIIDDMLRTFDDYNSQEFQQLRDRLVKLERDAKTIASVQGQIRTNRPLSATESISSSGSSNEQFITALRQQQLQNLERRYDIAFQRLLNEHQKLTEVLLRLARLNLDAANFNEILEILRGAINAVSQIRVNWGKSQTIQKFQKYK